MNSIIRLYSGPWYHITNPMSIIILDGYPASWESTLYIRYYSNFISSQYFDISLTEVQFRAFIPIGIAAFIASWTHEAYWSSAVVEILGWFCAAKGTECIGNKYNLSIRVCKLSGIFVCFSPLFVSQIWMHVFHLVEFSSLPWGILAIVHQLNVFVGVIKHTINLLKIIQLTIYLSLILFIISHIYVYQSILLVLFFIYGCCILLSNKICKIQNIIVLFSISVFSYILYNIMEFIFLFYIEYGGVKVTLTGTEIGGNPVNLLYVNLILLLQFESTSSIINILYDNLYESIKITIVAYHPILIVLCFISYFFTDNKIKTINTIMMIISICACFLYRAPWVAMTSYPTVYIMIAELLSNIVIYASRRVEKKYLKVVRNVLFWALIIATNSVTNLDVIGNTTFAKQWWKLYSNTLPS